MKISYSEEILTVLYVLYRARMGLKAENIVDCLEDTSIDYFTAHQILEHLVENHNIFTSQENECTIYLLSPMGKDAIVQFLPAVRASVRDGIDKYLKENLQSIRNAMETNSTYCFDFDDSYTVMLKSYDDSKCILDISLTVDSSETAAYLAEQWQEKAPEIYKCIIDKLTEHA